MFRVSGMAAAAATVLLCVCGTGHAGGKPAVLMFDSSIGQVSGALGRIGFERKPRGGERAYWETMGGVVDDAAVTAVAMLAMGAVMGAGVANVRAEAQRNASIDRLRKAVAEDNKLRRLFESEVRGSVEAQGYEIHRTLRANDLVAGFVVRGLEKPEDGTAIVLHSPDGPMVSLSWDDRQPLLAMDVRTYVRRDVGQLPIQERSRRQVRYVGRNSPAGQDARNYWATDGGAPFMAEVSAGLQHMLPLLWDDTIEVPKVRRKETTLLRIDGETLSFPGRLWKEADGVAYLFNSDKGITIVATAPSGTH